MTEFKTLELPKPKIEEQGRISEVLDSIQKDMQKKQYFLNKLELLKAALMQNLLTGMKRVTALMDDAEAANS